MYLVDKLLVGCHESFSLLPPLPLLLCTKKCITVQCYKVAKTIPFYIFAKLVEVRFFERNISDIRKGDFATLSKPVIFVLQVIHSFEIDKNVDLTGYDEIEKMRSYALRGGDSK